MSTAVVISVNYGPLLLIFSVILVSKLLRSVLTQLSSWVGSLAQSDNGASPIAIRPLFPLLVFRLCGMWCHYLHVWGGQEVNWPT